jgi:hypothetical protein
MLDPKRVPVPLPDEMTINKVDSGVDLAVTIPPVNSSSGASSSREPQTPVPANTTGSFQKLKASGRAWLTDQRVRCCNSCCFDQRLILLVILYDGCIIILLLFLINILENSAYLRRRHGIVIRISIGASPRHPIDRLPSTHLRIELSHL